jgi:hypothetical protein
MLLTSLFLTSTFTWYTSNLFWHLKYLEYVFLAGLKKKLISWHDKLSTSECYITYNIHIHVNFGLKTSIFRWEQ